jgi:ATP-dependent Clp protease ATP-binding subunit ClpA
MYDLGQMTDKFSETGQKVIYRAIDESKSRVHNFLSVEHIFAALSDVENALFTESMHTIGLDPRAVSHLLEQELTKRGQHIGRKMYIADTTRELFDRALRRARQNGRRQIDSFDLFIALFSDPNGVPAEILRRLGVDPTRATEQITREE